MAIKVHERYNITFTEEGYEWFKGLTKAAKRKFLLNMSAFNHLGKKEKDEEVNKIIDATPNAKRNRKKVKQTNSESNRSGKPSDNTE